MKRLLATASVAFFCAYAFASSNPPAPAPVIRANPPQGKAGDANHGPKAEQRGTKESPLFVEGLITAKPSEQETARETRESKEKSANENLSIRLSGLNALFTGFLMLIALVQAYLFLRQLGYMRVSLRDTKIAAEAAKISSEAVMLAERAYLKVVFSKEGLQWKWTRRDAPSGFEIDLSVKNFGRTPASVTDIRLGCSRREHEDLLPHDFPALIEKENREAAPNAFLPPNDDTTAHRFFGIRPESYTEVIESAQRLWVFAYVDYIDTFGKRHRAGSARYYEPIMEGGKDSALRQSPLRRFDFDRPRKQGEGNDWTS